MTNDESVLASPPTQDAADHVRDYSSFIRMFKYGAVVCFVIALLWTMLIKAYW